MRIILDTSIVLGESQSSFRYFSGLIPYLKKNPDLSLELVPSAFMSLPSDWYSEEQAYQPVLPSAPWLPSGNIKRALSLVKKMVEQKRKTMIYTKSDKQSLFHSFYYTLPPSPRIPLISMAHDATLELLDNELGLMDSFRKHLKSKRESLQEAKRVIAVSEATKRDISEIYDISPERIDCIYHAVSSDFYPSSDSKNLFSKPYLLQVGGRMHHRNFPRLLEAFALGGFQKDYLLVCAGEPWSPAELDLIHKWNLNDSITLVEGPSTERLRELYQRALMLVYPSLYEGFGFPLIEAMACGTPVATSSRSGSIPEIAGDSALYFDPRDPANIAKVISELLKTDTATEIRRKGFENIKRFSWNRTAAETIECYRKVFSE